MDLDGDLMGLLEASLFRPIRAVDVIKWLCIVSGAGFGVAAAYLKFKKRRKDQVHVLDGEAGRDPGYAPQKPTIALQDIDTNQNYDPSFINSPNVVSETPQRELSATDLLKTVTTINSAKKHRETTSKSLTEQFVQKEAKNLQTFSQNGHMFENVPSFIDKKLEEKSEENKPLGQNTNKKIYTQALRQKSETNDFSTVETMYNSSPLKSLELEMSNYSNNLQVGIDKSKGDVTDIEVNEITTYNDSSSEYKNGNENDSNVPINFDTDIQLSSPLEGQSTGNPFIDETRLFGESSLETPGNMLSSTRETENNENEVNNLNTNTRNSVESNELTHRTNVEELNSSEVEDINRIIAEISSLIPRRNNSMGSSNM